jgi:hypothetical protein
MNPGYKPGERFGASFETHEWNAITSARSGRRQPHTRRSGRLVRRVFDSVEQVDAPGQLRLTDADPVLGYVASLSRVLRATANPGQLEALLAAVREEVESTIAAQGCLALTATAGCLICR